MTPAIARLILALAIAAMLLFVAPARAAHPEVTPALVCAVQDSIRWRAPAWTEAECAEAAQAFRATAEPANLLAIAVLESQLRPRSVAWHGSRVADVGLMGIRCRLSPGIGAHARGNGPRSAGAPRGETAEPAGRCTNWPARGYTLEQLKDPVTNIAAGAKVLASKRKLCGRRAADCYLGDPKGRAESRTAQVRAIVAAFGGTQVKVKSERVRALARKIAASVRREPKGAR